MKKHSTRSPAKETARPAKGRAVSFVGDDQHPINRRFGRGVQHRRQQLGLTQEELAATSGLNRSFLSEIENGRVRISLERAVRLAEALQCELADLIKE